MNRFKVLSIALICLALNVASVEIFAADIFMITKAHLSQHCEGLNPKLQSHFEMTPLDSRNIALHFAQSLNYLEHELSYALENILEYCNARAHIVGHYLVQNHIKHGLIYALPKPFDETVMQNKNVVVFGYKLPHMGPRSPDFVWHFHVAPFVVGDDGKMWIFDHALSKDKPLNSAEWTSRFLRSAPDTIEFLVTPFAFYKVIQITEVTSSKSNLVLNCLNDSSHAVSTNKYVAVVQRLEMESSEPNLQVKMTTAPLSLTDYHEWHVNKFAKKLERLRAEFAKAHQTDLSSVNHSNSVVLTTEP